MRFAQISVARGVVRDHFANEGVRIVRMDTHHLEHALGMVDQFPDARKLIFRAESR